MGCNVIKYGFISIQLSIWSLDSVEIHKMIIYHVIFIIGYSLELYNVGVVGDFVVNVYLLYR